MFKCWRCVISLVAGLCLGWGIASCTYFYPNAPVCTRNVECHCDDCNCADCQCSGGDCKCKGCD